MSYPTLEQYNEAFQNPHVALADAELRSGRVQTTGLGLPLALCGGFALTYTITTTGGKYAVRCFHKQSNALEQRYASISNRLKAIRSAYFLDFEFQSAGVRVNGGSFPVVKMRWASGETLGEFLEQNHHNRDAMRQLHESLRSLAAFLEAQKLAHGDVQPGNVMVSDAGRKIQLIDYDGMFLDELRSLGSAELGHRNFQHPKRAKDCWDGRLDRFSFIALSLSLRSLEKRPDLWDATQSDGDAVLFRANDFADPERSTVFRTLSGDPALANDARHLSAICKARFQEIPTLDDFLAGRNIPQITVSLEPSPAAGYISAFPVLDAGNYAVCLSYVGDRVELIGRIVEVKQDRTRHGKPYTFINFGPWQGSIVKISIWSEGLAALPNPPTAAWVGKWISVTGLMEPPYRSKKYRYSHLSINITQATQIRTITDHEAQFRLKSTAKTRPQQVDNANILATMQRGGTLTPPSGARPVTSPNQAILVSMQASTKQGQSGAPTSSPSQKRSDGCFIATALYGVDAFETCTLRDWRDRTLMGSRLGRTAVNCYYRVSPHLVPLMQRSKCAAAVTRALIDRLVALIRVQK